ncbi:MAG: hypothetical protein ACPGGE_06240, partial [Poseidonia sp.]
MDQIEGCINIEYADEKDVSMMYEQVRVEVEKMDESKIGELFNAAQRSMPQLNDADIDGEGVAVEDKVFLRHVYRILDNK